MARRYRAIDAKFSQPPTGLTSSSGPAPYPASGGGDGTVSNVAVISKLPRTPNDVTSPTGFQEITQQTGFDVAKMFIDALEAATAGFVGQLRAA